MRRFGRREQTQVGIGERDLQKIVIIVGHELIDFLFLVVALLALLVQEHDDRERQADDRDDVAHQFPRFQRHGVSCLASRAVAGSLERALARSSKWRGRTLAAKPPFAQPLHVAYSMLLRYAAQRKSPLPSPTGGESKRADAAARMDVRRYAPRCMR